MDFAFRKMTKNDAQIVMDYRREFLAENDIIKGTKCLEDFDNFDEYCQNLELEKDGEPKMTQYLFIRKSDYKLVGMAIIRHELKNSNKNVGGHLGVGIRPSERKKGYGDLMIKYAFEECANLGITSILMTCTSKNLPSIKNIKKNGGKYAGDTLNQFGEKVERYWIDLKGEKNEKGGHKFI